MDVRAIPAALRVSMTLVRVRVRVRVRKTAKSPAPGGVQERVFARTLSLKLQEPEYSNHIDVVKRYMTKRGAQTYAHSAYHGSAEFSGWVQDGPLTSRHTT